MTRVNDAEVRTIRPSDTIDDYSPFIETASVVVDGLSTGCGSSFSDTKLTQIELYLAAHYGAVSDPDVVRERFENDEKTYQSGNRQMYGILRDSWGQTANMLSNGCLAELEKRTASVISSGYTYETSPIDS